MSVQHALRRGLGAVHCAVNEEGGGLDAVAAVNLAPGGIHYDEVARRDLGPVQALRIDEEISRTPRDLQAEVVADALAITEPVGPAQRSGKVDARFKLALVHSRVNPRGPRRPCRPW